MSAAQAWTWPEEDTVAAATTATRCITIAAANDEIIANDDIAANDATYAFNHNNNNKPQQGQASSDSYTPNAASDGEYGVLYESPLSKLSRAACDRRKSLWDMSLGRAAARSSAPRNPAARVTDMAYDNLGRLATDTQPRFNNDPADTARELSYDDLNRVTRTLTYDDNGANTTITVYQGYTQTHTNPKSQTRTDTRDAIGRIEQVTDALNGITRFTYDPFGNLTQTIDPNGNVIKVEYDSLGRKTKLTDPNLGRIDYFVDARGLTWKQISPKQRAANPVTAAQFTRTEYDLLGRMTGRFEPDLESRWDYDSATTGIGQLSEAYTLIGIAPNQTKDYRRTHVYDNLGRPRLTTQYLTDGIYTTLVTYDSYGRVTTTEHQRNSNAKKTFSHRYNAWGYLSQLQRGSLILWQIRQQDAQRNATDIRLGNGLTQQRDYDKRANRLKSASLQTADSLNTNPIIRLKEDYQYDSLGNVSLRSQYWDQNGYSETFGYDPLNRIITSQVSGQAQQTFAYDAVGNLTQKTGVGAGTPNSIVYPPQGVNGTNAIRPNAIQSVTGGVYGTGSYTYDDNGNLANGAGRTLTWTSFDMPLSVTKAATGTGPSATPAASATFTYGPEYQRTRQNKTEGTTTTVIYAGAQEVETKSGVTTIKTYWPHGIGVEIDRNLSGSANPNNNTSELNWTHTDRLGSPVAMSTTAGILREKLAYDAWGKRRTLDGAPITTADGGSNSATPTPDTIDGVTDNRGFTGHEMLDGLDLVHMNGRIYDPLTARFMSADPILQDPMNGQSYNRYSYVMNNPTNFTDPTGFSLVLAGAESRLEQAASQFARSDEATKTSATEKHGASIVTAILNIAKSGITAETMGAVMNAAGQLKESAKNVGAAVAGAVGGAVVGFVADQVTARLQDGATVLNATGTAVAYAGLKIAGNEAAADLASDALRVSRGEVAEAAVATATGGGSRNAKQALNAVESSVKKEAAEVGKKVHGNSLSSPKPTQGYTLRDRDTGEILKYGETARGQKRYSQKFLDKNNADMQMEARGSKREMHAWQHDKILEHKVGNGGTRPPLNKSDY